LGFIPGLRGGGPTAVVVEPKTKAIVWAYEVRKGGAYNHQSKAEAVAKHLKNWLETKR